MSTAQEIVIDAFELLSAIDINDPQPSPAEMTRALRALDQMIDGWASDDLNVISQTIAGTVTSGSAEVSNLATTSKLAVGMNVTGTGISASTRILTIDSDTQITLDTNATASGSAVSLLFAVVPFQPRYEEGVAALLALRIAPRIGEDNIPAMTVQLANDGWARLQANFMRTPEIGFDVALVDTFSRRTVAVVADE